MDYKNTFKQVALYIETHLKDDLKVTEVAKQTGYSYFHLNRQFHALLGESIGSYIHKRRLANAALELLYTNHKIIDIALDHQFESSEAFSRAFKTQYKISPYYYRQNHLHTLVSAKKQLDEQFLEHLIHKITIHPEIVDIEEVKIVGIRGETTLRDNSLKPLWEKFYLLQDKIPNRLSNGRRFGICELIDENIHYTLSNDLLFSDFIGIEVSSFKDIVLPFQTKIITGGRYAVFRHTGSLQTISDTLHYIWGTWLLNTKEEIDNREMFELYDHRFIGYDHPESQMDIYIPIKKVED